MRLFQGLMAFTIQGDTAFVSAKGLFQTQCSGFHVLYQLLQFLKGLFKAGNGEVSGGECFGIGEVCWVSSGWSNACVVVGLPA